MEVGGGQREGRGGGWEKMMRRAKTRMGRQERIQGRKEDDEGKVSYLNHSKKTI